MRAREWMLGMTAGERVQHALTGASVRSTAFMRNLSKPHLPHKCGTTNPDDGKGA